MKKHMTTILLFVVMFVGLGLLLYPPLADYVNSRAQSRAIARYTAAVDAGSENDYTELWDAANQYNASLFGTEAHVRLNKAKNGTLGGGYDKLLRMNDTMGIIEIPGIAVMLPLYHGVSDAVLQVAVGHLEGTSLPTGEIGTHAAFSAHRGLPSAKLFTNLDMLREGDTFTIRVLNKVMTYVVHQRVTVLPSDTRALEIDPDRDLCSLITCTPYGINSHRLIITGHRDTSIDSTAAAQAVRITADATEIDPLIVTPIVAAPMLLILLIVMLVSTSPAKKRRRNAAKKLTDEEIVQQGSRTSPKKNKVKKKEEHVPEDKNEQGGERL